MAPTPRTAWILGSVAFLGVLLPSRIVFLAAGLVLVAAAVDGLMVRRAPVVDRMVADVLSRGVESPLEITVRERSERTRVRQPATPDLRVEPSVSDSGLAATVTPVRRGRHHLPPVAARVTGPLGLARWTRSVGESRELSVFPDMPAARRIAALVRHGLFRTDGHQIRGRLGLGTAFEAIREYVEGDDVRQVNWLATSRTGRPMVNQYRIEQDRDVICVIDCGRLMGAPIGDMTRLDSAVDATAAVGAVADVVGDRVGVVAFDAGIIRDLKPMRRGGEPVARTIFDLQPSHHESDYRKAFELVAGAKRAFVIVLTDLLDSSAARPLVDAIGVLARKHAVVVAGVTDPDVAKALTSTPRSSEDAARAVVAVDVLEARASAVLALERHGARVIDVSHRHLNAACVAAYLEAKERIRF